MDLGLAMSLIDCAVVIAAPTVLGGIHPAAASRLRVNALRARGSYQQSPATAGRGGAIDQLTSMLGNLSAGARPGVVKGLPA